VRVDSRGGNNLYVPAAIASCGVGHRFFNMGSAEPPNRFHHITLNDECEALKANRMNAIWKGKAER
jgi:hypothetical protein